MATELFVLEKNIFWQLNLFSGRHQLKGAARGCDVSSKTFTNVLQQPLIQNPVPVITQALTSFNHCFPQRQKLADQKEGALINFAQQINCRQMKIKSEKYRQGRRWRAANGYFTTFKHDWFIDFLLLRENSCISQAKWKKAVFYISSYFVLCICIV